MLLLHELFRADTELAQAATLANLLRVVRRISARCASFRERSENNELASWQAVGFATEDVEWLGNTLYELARRATTQCNAKKSVSNATIRELAAECWLLCR